MAPGVSVQAVKFNHDPHGHNCDALNIRKNAVASVVVPEWRHGETTKPEQSPAAYAQKETKGNTITVKVKFKTGPGLIPWPKEILPPAGKMPKVGIRALDPGRLRKNVLGEVAETVVAPGDIDRDGFFTLPLTNVRLWDVGVGIYTVTWRWQIRPAKSAAWQDVGVTCHRVYVLLEAPRGPWQQMPHDAANLQLPWTEVLDYSCHWAAGSTSRDTATGKVAESIFSLGPALITYDCPGGGGTRYTDGALFVGGVFYCGEFLERLAGGLGLGQYVNCTDCATFLATFANILGCDLSEMVLGYSFALNEMIAIGSADFSLPCGFWPSFYYHEVAWQGSCDNEGKVSDACLEVDGDADPTTPPHTALLPVALRFGATGELGYRDRLSAPPGRPNTIPQCGLGQRRSVI
jgi:hypothetical protein